MPARSPYAGCSDLVALGAALRELRARRGVSQDAVTFDARLGRNYVSMVELGQINPSLMVLLWLVRTLGSSLAELIAVYDRHLAVIDPDPGRDVPLCPTPEALAYCQQSAERSSGYRKARRARSRMR